MNSEMEFSEYDGPFTAELQAAWPTLSEDQQRAIQGEADQMAGAFFLAALIGDEQAAGDAANDVVREAHRIAGLPIPDVRPILDLLR